MLIKAIKYFPPALLAEYPSKWQMPHPPIPEPPPINPLPDLRKGIYILTVLINVPLVFPQMLFSFSQGSFIFRVNIPHFNLIGGEMDDLAIFPDSQWIPCKFMLGDDFRYCLFQSFLSQFFQRQVRSFPSRFHISPLPFPAGISGQRSSSRPHSARR